jgi:hypothetical protein
VIALLGFALLAGAITGLLYPFIYAAHLFLSTWVFVSCFAGGCATYAALLAAEDRAVRSRVRTTTARSDEDRATLGIKRLTLDEEGVTLAAASGTWGMRLGWRAVLAIERADAGVFFRLGSRSGFLVPARAFASSTAAEEFVDAGRNARERTIESSLLSEVPDPVVLPSISAPLPIEASVEFEVMPGESFVHYQSAARGLSKWHKVRRFCAFALLMVLFAFVAAMGTWEYTYTIWDWGIVFWGWFAFLSLVSYAVHRSLERKRRERVLAEITADAAPAGFGRQRLDVSETGVQLASASVAFFYAWSRIVGIEDLADGVFVRQGPTAGILVPARAFSSPDEARAFAAVARECHSRASLRSEIPGPALRATPAV